MKFTVDNHTGQLMLLSPSNISTVVFAVPTGRSYVDAAMVTNAAELWKGKRDSTNTYSTFGAIPDAGMVTFWREQNSPFFGASTEAPAPDTDAYLFLGGLALPITFAVPFLAVRWFRRLALPSGE